MTSETLQKANELMERIRYLQDAKKDVLQESFIKKAGHRIPKEAMAAAKDAMLAVIDESIDAEQRELDAL